MYIVGDEIETCCYVTIWNNTGDKVNQKSVSCNV